MNYVVILLLLQLLIATRLTAEPRKATESRNEIRGDRDSMAFFGELNLSEEQKQQFQALKESESAGTEDWDEKLKDSKRRLKSLLAIGESEEEIWRAFRANQSLRNQRGENRFQRTLKIRRILTLEQRKELSPRHRVRRGRPNPKSGESRRSRKRED